MLETVEVKIAVGINLDGQWWAVGSSGIEGRPAMIDAIVKVSPYKLDQVHIAAFEVPLPKDIQGVIMLPAPTASIEEEVVDEGTVE